METQQRNDSRSEPLNDSWVELHFQGQTPGGGSTPGGSQGMGTQSPQPALSRPVTFNSQMEKLLLEAQRESSRSSTSSSRNASIPSSRGSPKSPHSPNNELVGDQGLHGFPGIPEVGQESVLLTGTDWIWDWSSRPEAHPPSDWGSRFKHPRRHKLSVRNTRVMANGPFSMENLPTLLFTHACTFIMGAAVMFIYLKKYCNWTAMTASASMD